MMMQSFSPQYYLLLGTRPGIDPVYSIGIADGFQVIDLFFMEVQLATRVDSRDGWTALMYREGQPQWIFCLSLACRDILSTSHDTQLCIGFRSVWEQATEDFLN